MPQVRHRQPQASVQTVASWRQELSKLHSKQAIDSVGSYRDRKVCEEEAKPPTPVHYGSPPKMIYHQIALAASTPRHTLPAISKTRIHHDGSLISLDHYIGGQYSQEVCTPLFPGGPTRRFHYARPHARVVRPGPTRGCRGVGAPKHEDESSPAPSRHETCKRATLSRECVPSWHD